LAPLVAAAVLSVFRRRVTLADPAAVLASFEAEAVVHTGDDLDSAGYVAVLHDLPALAPPVRDLAGPEGEESPALLASALEFLLEGLHLTKRLNKDASGGRALYRSRK
jgi:magnesium chelatase subunit I